MKTEEMSGNHRSLKEWERQAEKSKLRSMERRLAEHERRVKRKFYWSLAVGLGALLVLALCIAWAIWYS